MQTLTQRATLSASILASVTSNPAARMLAHLLHDLDFQRLAMASCRLVQMAGGPYQCSAVSWQEEDRNLTEHSGHLWV